MREFQLSRHLLTILCVGLLGTGVSVNASELQPAPCCSDGVGEPPCDDETVKEYVDRINKILDFIQKNQVGGSEEAPWYQRAKTHLDALQECLCDCVRELIDDVDKKHLAPPRHNLRRNIMTQAGAVSVIVNPSSKPSDVNAAGESFAAAKRALPGIRKSVKAGIAALRKALDRYRMLTAGALDPACFKQIEEIICLVEADLLLADASQTEWHCLIAQQNKAAKRKFENYRILVWEQSEDRLEQLKTDYPFAFDTIQSCIDPYLRLHRKRIERRAWIMYCDAMNGPNNYDQKWRGLKVLIMQYPKTKTAQLALKELKKRIVANSGDGRPRVFGDLHTPACVCRTCLAR